MTVQLLSHVRAVTPGRIVEDATVATEDGRVVAIEEHRSYVGAVDGRGAFCLPGLVDSHCDAIEREISPRPTARFDVDFALRSLERRFLGSGITTAFHGVRFGNEEDAGIEPLGPCLVDAIVRRREEHPRLDHRILYRVPARGAGAVERARTRLDAVAVPGESPLLSFEDHTPGQGQYRDLAQYKAAMRHYGADSDADAEVDRRLREAVATLPVREANVVRIGHLAAEGTARILAHDCVDEEEVAAAVGWGAAVAEFPVTIEAARAARDRGMPVVLGAPNVLLGGSHSGNLSAEVAITAGLCTGLASDYLPPSMLAAAFDLAGRNVLALPDAVHLVTAGPAEVAGHPDRGQLRVGAPADLILVALEGRWPSVVAVLTQAAERVLMA